MSGSRLHALMKELELVLQSPDRARLDVLPTEIETAFAEIDRLDRDEIAAIRATAERNARRLAAMRSGLRAARRRLAEIALAEQSMTYDGKGAKVQLGAERPGQRF